MLSRAVARFDRHQRRHSWAGLPVGVVYKFVDDQGAYLVALIAHYAFISLFPLLLIATSVLGFVLQNDQALQARLVTNLLDQVPLVSDQLSDSISTFRGSGTGLVIGVVGTLYGGLGVAQAGQNALNIIWGVPRNARPNPVAARVRSLGLLVVFGTAVLATSALALAAGFSDDDVLNAAVSVPVSMLVNGVAVAVLFRYGTTHPTSLREVAPGAVAAGILVQLLQLYGAYLLSSSISRSNALYGGFGVVLGLIAWITLQAAVLVVCAEVNTVLAQRLWPRALLTPFTDAVQLTQADRRAYTGYARAQRHKGFETVEVRFAPPEETPTDERAPARRPPAPLRPPARSGRRGSSRRPWSR